MCLPRPDVWSCISAAGPTRQRQALPDFVPRHRGCLYWFHFALHQSIWTWRMSPTFIWSPATNLKDTMMRRHGLPFCESPECKPFSRCLTLHVFLYFRSVPCRQLSLHKLSSNSFNFLLSTPQLSQSLLRLLSWRKPQLRALPWHGTLGTLNLCLTTLSSTGPRPQTPTSKK